MTPLLLIVWSIRVAIVAWLVAVLIGRPRWQLAGARCLIAWTLSGLMLQVHWLCAMHFVHRWNWESVWRETARQTAEVVGFEFGGGVIVNVIFAAWWLCDAAWRWRQHRRRQSVPRSYDFLVHAVWTFLFFNAVVVFRPR